MLLYIISRCEVLWWSVIYDFGYMFRIPLLLLVNLDTVSKLMIDENSHLSSISRAIRLIISFKMVRMVKKPMTWLLRGANRIAASLHNYKRSPMDIWPKALCNVHWALESPRKCWDIQSWIAPTFWLKCIMICLSHKIF